jgi:D-glycero-D-manno-heptose 1,7-bisphosphate phosphatase
MTERPAVFLDRDGVLTRSHVVDGVPRGAVGLDDLELLPDAAAACAALDGAGLPLVVVTNQPDIARGTLDAGVVDAQHRELRRLLPLLEIVVCPHDDPDGCACRKPAPGMLLDAAARHGLDLGASVMVGDRWRDVDAGRAAGCRTVFVDRGYDERAVDPDLTVAGLLDAVPWILDVTRREDGAR